MMSLSHTLSPTNSCSPTYLLRISDGCARTWGTRQRVEEEDPNSQIYEKLEEIQDNIEKLNEASSEEVIQIEKKYNEKRKPLYQQRNDMIKQIPLFWKTTLLTHASLVDHITEVDIKVLDYLEELNVEDAPDVRSGFSITMKFKPNPFFKNTELQKEFKYGDGPGECEIKATKIEWKGKIDDASFFTIWFQNDRDEYDEVAQLIKEDIWPDPSKYYHGVLTGDETNEAETFDDDDEDNAE